MAIDGVYAGCILISDEVKADSKAAIAALKQAGIEKTVMLTGDDEKIGTAVANALGLDEVCAQLLPNQKVEKLEELDKKKRPVASWPLLAMASMTHRCWPVQMWVSLWADLAPMPLSKLRMWF